MSSSICTRFCSLLIGAIVLLAGATAAAMPGDLEAELIVDGLQFPVKMTSLGDGDLLINEKMGRVRLMRDGELLDAPVAQFDVKVQNEAGLLDVVLTPEFEDSGEFLVSYTPEDNLEAIYVSRLVLDGDSATVVDDPLIELPSTPGADRHFAGTMAYDTTGEYLYVSVGELRDPPLSQDLDTVSGSVLRYTPDGEIAEGNPFGDDNAIYAYGMRNPFGITVDDDDQIFIVENSGDVNDELNHVEAGLNYGWPLVEGYCDNFPIYEPCEDAELFEDPIFEFRTVNGPTSVIRYQEEMIPDFDGDLMVTGWHSGQVHHLSWGGAGERAEERGILFETPTSDAGFTDLHVDDDGSILVLESSSSSGAVYRIARADDIHDPDATVNSNDDGSCAMVGLPGQPVGLIAVIFLALGIRRDLRGDAE